MTHREPWRVSTKNGLDSFPPIRPVMDSQYPERRVERPILKREILSYCPQGRRGVRWTLLDHPDGGLDCNDKTVCGLVRARSRTHVQNALTFFELPPERRCDSRIRSSASSVINANLVICLL